MKKILALIVSTILLLSLSIDAYAAGENADAAENVLPCGTENAPDGTGARIAPRNGTICPEDLAFQGSYLFLSEIFQNQAVRPFVLVFIDENTLDSEFTNYADEVIGVSAPIYLIFSSVAILSSVLATFVIAFKAYLYFSTAAKMGDANFIESRGDKFLFYSYLSVLFLMLIPLGVSGGKNSDKGYITIGQAVAAVGSLPANMGGNYIFSTYLSVTDTASRDINMKEGMLLPNAQVAANTMIEGQMCQINTRQALLNVNAKTGSAFFHNTSIGELFDYDQDNIADRYDYCLAYTGDAEEGDIDGSMVTFNLNKYDDNFAGGASLLNPFLASVKAMYGGLLCGRTGFERDIYGHPHTCLRVNYDFGQNKFGDMEALTEESVDGESDSGWENAWNYLVGDDVGEMLKETYSAGNFFSRYRRVISPLIESVLNDTSLDSAQRYEKLEELFSSTGADVFSSSLAGNSFLRDASNEEKLARHQVAAAFLLGGSFERGGLDNIWENGPSAAFSHSRIYHALERDEDSDPAYGLDYILNEAWDAAELARAQKCAETWDQQYEARKFIYDYNRFTGHSELEELFSASGASYQCVKFLQESEHGSDDTNRFAAYMVDDPDAFGDVTFSDGNMIRLPPNDPEVARIAKKMREEVAPALMKEYQLKKWLITGYTMSAKKAVADNLKEALNPDNDEIEQDINLRPRGWGMFGGALLYTGQTQQSAMSMGRSIDGAMLVSSAASSDGNYVNAKAFGSNQEAFVKVGDLFEAYRDDMFTIGSAATHVGSSRLSDSASEEEAMQQFFAYLEQMLFSPLNHVKAASGMRTDQSLMTGLQTCFDQGYESCLSGNRHPVIALSHFGNDMINQMIDAMVLTGILEVTVMAIKRAEGDSEEGSVSEGDGNAAKKKKTIAQKAGAFVKDMIGKLGKVVGGLVMAILQVVIVIIKIASVIMSALMPVFTMLLVVGVVFAYILPMMAYLFSLMMLVLFWVGLVVTIIIIPIYALIKLLTVEKDYQNGFKLLWQDLMSVYATPFFFSISAVISWTTIVVIMYALNVSFAILNQGLAGSSSDTFGLSSLVFNVLMYVVYLVSIFILFRFGLGIMKSMPDMLKEKVNLKRSDDDQYISSLGFEQYVQAQITKTISDLPSKIGKSLREHASNGGYMTMKSLQKEVERAESVANQLGLEGLSRDEIVQRGRENGQAMMAGQKNNGQNNSSGANEQQGEQRQSQVGPREQQNDDSGNVPGGKDGSAPQGEQGSAPDQSVRPTAEPDNVSETGNTRGQKNPVFTRGDATADDAGNNPAPDKKTDDKPSGKDLSDDKKDDDKS